jgi:hypothetical protein
MLAPDDRHLFLQSLRPPEGYKFDRGIGTTYTLDLFTLLVTPLSLAFFEYESPDKAFEDPLALLESLRRYADRLLVFCEAGQIDFPTHISPLLSYLEKMVIEVRPPRDGAFHPKFWLLRYVSEDAPPLYRLLNLSRNLTFDRSWDLILQLEGETVRRQKGFSRNRPISDFLNALAGMVKNERTVEIQERLSTFSDEVMRVDFAPVEGFDDISFHPSGIPGYRGYRFKDLINHLLVISPFLTDSFLKQLTAEGENHVLISRVESLDQLSIGVRERFENIFTLNEGAEQEPLEESSFVNRNDRGAGYPQNNHDLTGLHAKLLVWDSGWNAVWLVGSANATAAGYHRNVEFMVELCGKKSVVGIDRILSTDNQKNALINLLVPYQAPVEKPRIDPDQRQAEILANNIRKWLIRGDIELLINAGRSGNFDVSVIVRKMADLVPGKYSIDCWPVSLPETRKQPFVIGGRSRQVLFTDVSLVSLTAFMAFDISVIVNQAKYTNRFVLYLPISGLPPERDNAILSSVISDKARFLRYLRLLLLDDETDPSRYWSLFSTEGNPQIQRYYEDMPLLEEIVLALSRSHNPGGKIDRINDLVGRIKRTAQWKDIIPPEFDTFWQVVLKAVGDLR